MFRGYTVILFSIFAGLCVWVIDAALDFLFFLSEISLNINTLLTYQRTFLDMLIFEVPRQKLFLRTIIIFIFLIFGYSISTYYSQFLQERALRIFEQRGKDITERSFNIMHIGKNVKGAISHVSPAVKEVIGYPPEDVVGKPFQSFLPETEREKIDDIFDRALQGEVTPGSTKVFRKNGSLASVQINAFPIILEGKVVGFIGNVRDISG